MAPSTLSTTLLYTASFLASATVAAHTKMGYDVVFPALKTLPPKEPGVRAARIGWMECNQAFVFMALFTLKWANRGGLTDIYDKAFLGLYSAAQLMTGIAYIRAGMYEPLIAVWGIPVVAGAGLLV